jgi:ribose transport system permease protein
MSAPTPMTVRPRSLTLSPIWKRRAIDYNAWLLLLILAIFGASLTPLFATASNLSNVLEQSAIIGVLAIGQFLVVLTGGIDLSVGSVMALMAMLGAMSMPLGGLSASIITILAGAITGAISGLIIVKGHLPPFIVTFGMLAIARGVALTLTGGEGVSISQDSDLAMFGFGIWPVLVWAVAIAAVCILLSRTRTGIHIYSAGGNIEASRVSGINTGGVIVLVYSLSGVCGAIAGLLVLARSGVALPTFGEGYELQTIAAVVVGGVSLFGGEGRLSGAVIGVIFMTMLSNVLDLIGANPFWSFCVIGAVLWFAVIFRSAIERIR